MSSTIILAPGEVYTRIGLSSSPTPLLTLPSTQIPLIPARTLSTKLKLFCATHLSHTNISSYTLLITEPCINFSSNLRQNIIRATINHLQFKNVHFITWNQWASAILGNTTPSIPLMLIDIGHHSSRIFTTHASEIIPRGGWHVACAIKEGLLQSDIQIDIEDVQKLVPRWAIIPIRKDESGVSGLINEKVVSEKIRGIGGKVLFDQLDDECNLAHAVAKVLEKAPDVYSRACLGKRIVIVGATARMSGFVGRLLTVRLHVLFL